MWKPLNSAAQFGYRTAFGLFELPMAGTQRLVGISRIAWVFLLPNLLIFGLFTFLPIILNFFYATTGSDAILLSQRPYVGAENFSSLLSCTNYLDPNTCRRDVFWRAVYNTGWFVVLQVGFMVVISLITALVLNRDIPLKGFFRGVFFYPVLLSPVVVALIWKWILQRYGVLNAGLEGLGLSTVNWLIDANWAFFWVIFVSIWAHMGFYTLILLAGLQSIPSDVYEAAEMDGASRWRVFAKITMPLLMPTMVVVLVLSLIRAVQAFDEIFVLTGGGPGSATTLILQYIYETGFASRPQLFGLAAAASILMAVVLLVLTLLQLRATRSQAEG
ncbi:carbohydrate ABC transporter permease [Aurantimonas sp. VKM B-3413]|uniref:carbohydrate ABC transporter permease n=1 Tax=Aurantimonas sp. VKM B-3413 TaxID=2779401 RepID=UPI001E31E2C5|nr:sugar ABC transporter permease [Aurantimonas sp. VKM B-3413]MCB8838805.1 sugar ABC transporter permease [Aurantimonas sp. VKM B-3413]